MVSDDVISKSELVRQVGRPWSTITGWLDYFKEFVHTFELNGTVYYNKIDIKTMNVEANSGIRESLLVL